MKKSYLIISFLTLLLFSGSLFSQFNEKNLRMEPALSGCMVTFKNLRVYFILASDAFQSYQTQFGTYTGLDAALAGKKLKITESKAGATVPTLFVENESKDTVFLMAGQVVKGGNQDRVLAQDMVIPPNSGARDISVFCVEKGRWHSAESGNQFNKSTATASANVRKAAVTQKNQSEVWKEVDVITKANDATTSTSTYNALFDNKEYVKNLAEYLAALKNSDWKDVRVVGMLAVTGDRVIGCDIFATHDLFQKSFEVIAQSYITEAISGGSKVTIVQAKVNEYLSGFLANEGEQEERIKGKGEMFRNGDRKLHLSTF